VSDPLPPSWPAVAAGVVAGGVTVLYLIAMTDQGTWSTHPERAVFFALLLGLASLAAFLGAFLPSARGRVIALAVASAELFLLGVLALPSIGVLLLLAGVLALVALLSLRGHAR
jgi:hypothetical protein